MNKRDLISELVGESYPAAVPVGPGRLRRNWIVRTAALLASEAHLENLGAALQADAAQSIEAAYASHATATALAAVGPSVHLTRLDDYHLVVRIVFAGPESTVGDAAAISQWGVLQALDRRVRLDELQGLPREHWFFLRAGRDETR